MTQITNPPSAEAQLLLELANRSRMDPAGEYARSVGVQDNIDDAIRYFGVDLATLARQYAALEAVAPLAWSDGLATAATAHSQLMRRHDTQSHQLPGEASLGDRIREAGYTNWSRVGENVYAYTEDMTYGHVGFMIDWGYDAEDMQGGVLLPDWRSLGDGIQDPPGHRNSLMSPGFTEIGIGVVADDDPRTAVGPYLVTQNFGSRRDYQAQLLGVVIQDRDGDGFYDIGEGLGGITITATGAGGSYSTQTWAAGGYQMVLPAGSYTVTFSGGGLAGQWTQNVTIGTANVKLDALASNFVTIGRTITGTDRAERLEGTAGADRILGMGGNDTIYGGDGADTLNGGDGDDFIYGGATSADLRDLIYGGNGHDYIDGGWGNDEIHGGAGNDSLYGGFGADTLIGNEGDDVLSGGAGADEIHGGAGNDWINGGFGHDRLNGGAGADVFYHQGVADHGSDWIQDYRAAQGDVLAVGLSGATRSQFQVNFAVTAGAGAAGVAEAFVIYRPTGQVLFALVDGAGQDQINLQIGGRIYDLLA